MNRINFGLNFLSFCRISPDIVPINVRVCSRTGPRDGEDVLRTNTNVAVSVSPNTIFFHLRVLLRLAMACSVTLEIVDQGPTLVSKVAEIDSLAAGTEKKQAVKCFEKLSRWLMDAGAQLVYHSHL